MYGGIFKHQNIIPKYEDLMVALFVCTRNIPSYTTLYRHMTVYGGICQDKAFDILGIGHVCFGLRVGRDSEAERSCGGVPGAGRGASEPAGPGATATLSHSVPPGTGSSLTPSRRRGGPGRGWRQVTVS